ncbi:MAG: hypothetical protein ACPG19_12440 [Saprospiraceae bacterium]
MLKDIPKLKVTDLGVAIVPKKTQSADNEVDLWDVYLVNLKKDAIFSIFINSRGYGIRNNEEIKTTNFRFSIEELTPESYVKIESISTEVFDLTNEYWISFKEGTVMYDKKFIFVKGSIDFSNFTAIPMLNELGVFIK